MFFHFARDVMTALDTRVARKREIAMSREQWLRDFTRVSADPRNAGGRVKISCRP